MKAGLANKPSGALNSTRAFALASLLAATLAAAESTKGRSATPSGACPPFHLRDELGAIIDPVHGINHTQPYSPKQTCGGCHDYAKITEGYHFQQGKDEQATREMSERYQWVSSPGDYGGNWCSPAPLYRQLAPKKNQSARMIDMTSFEFVTATCGVCHPGGGPLEYDREGYRYDELMLDPSSGLTLGGDNNLDGDYYKSFWSQSGVIEADCLICHMPEYSFDDRKQQIANFNFRWAATAGAGLATVKGSVKEGTPVSVAYNVSLFGSDGKLSPHVVPEPRNKACLNCHAEPNWKKRAASFSARTDVHIAAGLKCVDCHPAGTRAPDPRIHGREVHQIAKADDPSGHVRDDLDNTMRTCEDCHIKGYLSAPLAKHDPEIEGHFEKVACQTCHVPMRAVKSAMVQVSDVFNAGPKISPPPKTVWTFYDHDLRYFNLYGELSTFTVADQPTDPYRPELAYYKGKIYPVNRVHSAWPGIEETGKPGLNQPFMKDVYRMWVTHNADPQKYPELSEISDETGDGVPEVNRPQEIEGMIASVHSYLKDTGFDLEGKRIVWVMDDRVYYSGTKYREVPKHHFEASPYASVYKYSHDVFPAKAALGRRGCTDCHSKDSPFFVRQVVKYPFGLNGKPVLEPQYRILGIAEDRLADLLDLQTPAGSEN